MDNLAPHAPGNARTGGCVCTNENALRVDGPQGVEGFGDLAYLSNRRGSPGRRSAQSSD